MKSIKYVIAGLFVVGLAACGSDSEAGSEGVKDGSVAEGVATDGIASDQGAQCKATATTKQEACFEMKDTLCERLTSDACATFASLNECDTWWAETFGACDNASTDPLPTGLQEGDLTTCICNIPTANCTALEDPGFDQAIPACGQALDTMAGQ